MNHVAPAFAIAQIAFRQQRIRDDYRRANSRRRYLTTRRARRGEIG